MKKFIKLFFCFALASFMFTACGDDECSIICEAGEILDINCECVSTGGGGSGAGNLVIVSNNITSDETWTAGNSYVLGGRIIVESGATLTIQPGTIIKGEAGAGANSTVLLIARGAKINALGTADAPIIFTSVADEIVFGQVSSPNLSPNQSGLWGGVIILGYAPISADAESVQIEGIPPSDINGLYGGTDATDNSGVFRYVSIRHGGTDIGEGNEINGLTLGGVGNGTELHHVEIVGNVDDGIEFFGGTVNATDLLVVMQGDDAFDGDQGYSGTVDNFVNIAGSASDHALEFDGPEGSNTGSFTFINGTCKGWNDEGAGGGEYADFRSDLRCHLENVYFFNFSEDSDFELDNNDVAANYLAGMITTKELNFNVDHLSAGNLTCDAIMADKSDAGDAFRQIDSGCNIVRSGGGANTAEFHNWSWAHDTGLLDF